MTEHARPVAQRDSQTPGSTSAALLEGQKQALEMIVQGRPLPEILDALCKIVEAEADRPVRAAILLVDASGQRLFTGAAPSLPKAYSKAVDGIAITPNVGTCAAAAARRQVVLTANIATDPAWAALSHLPLELGLKAAWSMPIVSSTGIVLGTFGTYFMETREPFANERRLVEVLARTAALAIERQQRDEALRASEQRYRVLVETMAENHARLDYAVRLSGVGFWYCDLPFDELVWDARVKDHFFLAPDTRVTIEDFYARIHQEDRAPTREAIEASIRNATSYDIVYRTVSPESGAIKWIRALGGTAYGADGAPTHFDGVTVDVSVQNLDQQRLADLNEQLREQDRRKDEFLATLAHELRNPLAPIRTGIEILRASTSPEHAARVREMMERQLAHMVRMVGDLLDISRVTLGKVMLKKERVDFRTVLHSALETTRPLIEAGAHELAVRLPQAPFPLDVDPTRLAQVIANLVNNSAKYTHPGGRIQLTAEAEGNMLVVRVSDTGVGIPADMLPRVFDIFTQIGRSVEHQQGGLGIGLTLVRRLVEMHGGTVDAESAGVGQGSTFTVRLPLATNLPEPLIMTDMETAAANETATSRIVVVDDNVDAAESLAMLLNLSGHTTRIAHTGEAAIVAVLEFAPDIAIVDIGLPGLSGHEVARRLRADPNVRKPLVLVALTGWGTEEDRRQAHAAGFDWHLVKPVDFDKLAEVLATPRA